MGIENQTVIQIFYKMLKCRLFEEKLVLLSEQGLVGANLKLSFGQEAVIGAVYALNDDDIILSGERSFAQAIAADVDCELMFSELLSDKNGLCGGVSGGETIADNTVNYYGASALSGAQFFKACGAAMALKIQGKENVVACFSGDGDCAQGSFYEALNLACLKKLPVVFFVENNCYAGREASENVNSTVDIAQRAKAFDIPGLVVDGNDAAAVYEAMQSAREFALSGGPVLVEAKTFRLAGYTYEEDGAYRDEAQIGQWVAYDAVENMKEYMIQNNIGILEDLVMLRGRIKTEVDEACDAALNTISAPAPETDENEQTQTSANLDMAELLSDFDE